MFDLFKLTDNWYIKISFAIITTLFSSFRVSLVILCSMIIIDTITGCIYAIWIKKFNSRGFRRGVYKILMYFTCILVVRLLELGISSIINTTHLTDLVIGYLIITESFSTMENLTLLGAPIPYSITKIIVNRITNKTFKEILLVGIDKKNYVEEISDIIEYQFAYLKDKNSKKLVEIELKEWEKFITILDYELSEAENYSNELQIYKVLALIDATNKKISEQWKMEDVPKECLESFEKIKKTRNDKYLLQVKEICEGKEHIDKKKTQLIDKLMIVLYQTLIDVQKSEQDK